MSPGQSPSAGPFRGFTPFDEAAADQFFGRQDELAALIGHVQGPHRVAVLAGEEGAGKTSLVRAGLVPWLEKRNVRVLVLGSYDDLGAEILRAASRLGAPAQDPNEPSLDYLERLLRLGDKPTLLILDHLEGLLASPASGAPGAGATIANEPPSATASATISASTSSTDASSLGERVKSWVEEGDGKFRLLLVVASASLAELGRLLPGRALVPASDAWMTLGPLPEKQATAILERTVLESGTFFENGLSSALAHDLCGERGCLALHLQLGARAVLEERLTTLRRYRESGGVPLLIPRLLERLTNEAGGEPARQLLLLASEHATARTAQGFADLSHLPRPIAEEALRNLASAGLLRRWHEPDGDRFALAHPGLRPAVQALCARERAWATEARRTLRQHLATGERLRLTELVEVRRSLGRALAKDEQSLFRRSVRRQGLQAAAIVAVVAIVAVIVAVDARNAYTLGFEPPQGGAGARVVVRAGKPPGGFWRWLPGRGKPGAGALLADTGFASSSLAEETRARIAEGRATGALETPKAGGGVAPLPTWLRDVLSGLRPVPRGVAKMLLGDADGVTALKQAFADPRTRRETLEALAVVGRGGAGEDEILSAALTDPAPEIRRRGVEVAAAIDRRRPNGTQPSGHGAILRNALADRSPDVRRTVLEQTLTLAAREAADVLAIALRDPDAGFRKKAEEITLVLAERAPAEAAEAAQRVLQSPDAAVRRTGLSLLERIGARAPAACAEALARVVATEQAPEEARLAALLVLRRAGPPSPSLRPFLEKAVATSAAPRLRAAALPLYARLIDPAAAEELARSEMKGPTTARAAAAAIWGAVAVAKPEDAEKPLKSFIYDPAVEVRIEAARSFPFLKRDGLALVDKLLKDSNVEVQRAAVESAVALASVNAVQVAEMLGKAVKNARPGMRREILAALGRLAETKPAAVLPPLAHAIHDQDPGSRAAAANALCGVAKRDATAASPYLRIAARDENREVRAAAAACLPALAVGDPRGAAKLAAELATSNEPPVRVAAAEALGRLGGKAHDVAAAALLKLISDDDQSVRLAAAGALATQGELGSHPGATVAAEPARSADAERVLLSAFLQASTEERRALVQAAAKNALVKVLRQAIADQEETVRLAAVHAAGELVPPALDVVREAVDDRAESVRAEATRILASASGAGGTEVLPIYAAMLSGGDRAARETAARGLGDIQSAGPEVARLLTEALGQRSEAVRTASAKALGVLAGKNPSLVASALERALGDSADDVRSAAIPGLAEVWARTQSVDALVAKLRGNEVDSPRRLVALEALVAKVQHAAPAEAQAARKSLDACALGAPPLGRLAAQLGRAFLDSGTGNLHAFVERLLGG